MTTKNKPTETITLGVSFRSYLEARWASLLNLCGINFIYEPEVIDGKYAPDFYLPDYDIYIEIKPDQPKEGEIKKATECGKKIFFIVGYPKHELSWSMGAAYYDSYFTYANGENFGGFHSFFFGELECCFELMALVEKAGEIEGFWIAEYIPWHLHKLQNGERAIRTAEVKSDHETNYLMDAFLKAVSHHLGQG